MSLVNDMLKDLDRRQAPDQNPLPGLTGYGALTQGAPRRSLLPFILVGAGLLVLVLSLLWYYRGMLFVDKPVWGSQPEMDSAAAIQRQPQASLSSEPLVEHVGAAMPTSGLAAGTLEKAAEAKSDHRGEIDKKNTDEPFSNTRVAPKIQQDDTVSSPVVEVVESPAPQSRSAKPAVANTKTKPNVEARAVVALSPPESAAKATQPEKQSVPVPKKQPKAEPGGFKNVVKTPEQLDAEVVAQAKALLSQGIPGQSVAAAVELLRTNIAVLDRHEASSEMAVLILIHSGRIADAKTLLQSYPVSSQALSAQLRARILQAQGNVEEAILTLEVVQVSVSEAPDHHVLLAAMYQQLGRYADAVTEYAGLVGLDESVGNWWAGLGISLEGAGQPAAGLRAYGRAVQLRNLNPDLGSFVAQRMEHLKSLNLK